MVKNKEEKGDRESQRMEGIFNSVIKQEFTGSIRAKKKRRPKGMRASCTQVLQAEETACAKALRQEQAWENDRRPVWLEKRGGGRETTETKSEKLDDFNSHAKQTAAAI